MIIFTPNLKSLLLIGFYFISIGGAIYFTSSYKDGQYALKEKRINDEYILQLKKQEEKYLQKIEELNQKALKQQEELAKLNSELELRYAKAKKQVYDITTKYNALISNGWRLRDPGKDKNNANGKQMCETTKDETPTPTISSNTTPSGGELSKEASEFLLRFASEADEVVEQLKIAQEYALRLKKICESENE